MQIIFYFWDRPCKFSGLHMKFPNSGNVVYTLQNFYLQSTNYLRIENSSIDWRGKPLLQNNFAVGSKTCKFYKKWFPVKLVPLKYPCIDKMIPCERIITKWLIYSVLSSFGKLTLASTVVYVIKSFRWDKQFNSKHQVSQMFFFNLLYINWPIFSKYLSINGPLKSNWYPLISWLALSIFESPL